MRDGLVTRITPRVIEVVAFDQIAYGIEFAASSSRSIFKAAQRAFEEALRSSLERIVTASGPGFGDWQWRLATLPFAFGGLGVYSAGDVRHYAFLASRLQSAGLQTKLLRHTGNPSEVAAPILMKKLADVYFTKVTASAESTFSLSPRQSALWKSQQGDHTSAWLRAVPILGLGQTMNAKTYRCVLCYRKAGLCTNLDAIQILGRHSGLHI
ncbi:uncharacterized protein [Rutidosis leptorrhynchoides]|uniref:uncharacterized protein n=1 Tax=Rutidosis leptorrhynchoides TaxID=125765 RepID=UPI003A9988A2